MGKYCNGERGNDPAQWVRPEIRGRQVKDASRMDRVVQRAGCSSVVRVNIEEWRVNMRPVASVSEVVD